MKDLQIMKNKQFQSDKVKKTKNVNNETNLYKIPFRLL